MDDRVPIPREVRAFVLARADRRCEGCGDKLALELHHLTYWRYVGKHQLPIFGDETPDDLKALCRDCHLHRHIGPDDVFYADPEECKGEWDYFHHMNDKDD